MTIQSTIEQKINGALQPKHLDVINESSMHNVPADSESHFKVTIVSDQFEGKRLLERHRMLNELLAEQLAGQIHALSLNTLTPDEWAEKHGEVRKSPPCLGGSKAKLS